MQKKTKKIKKIQQSVFQSAKNVLQYSRVLAKATQKQN